jgi:DNA-binding transcriptional ArsR family regulator
LRVAGVGSNRQDNRIPLELPGGGRPSDAAGALPAGVLGDGRPFGGRASGNSSPTEASRRLTGKYLLAYSRASVDIDRLLRAIANPARRRLLDRLRVRNGQTLAELCRHLDMTRQAVSQHLERLEEVNLVATVRRGREKLHYLNPVPIHEIYERWIEKYERQRLEALRDLRKRLEGEDDG